MKVEKGKYYKTRNGSVVGPMQHRESLTYPWYVEEGFSWTCIGRQYIGGENPLDLVEEVRQPPCDGKPAAELGPVRTVTRKEIVECACGPADRLHVYKTLDSYGYKTGYGFKIMGGECEPLGLREFARLLTEIADAMEKAKP